MIEWDKDNPLARARGEKKSANAALNDYWLLFNGLSLAKLSQHYIDNGSKSPTKSLSTLRYWSSTYDWQARIERVREIRRNEADRLWLERQEQIREKDYSQAEKMRQIADDILAQAPMFKRSTKKIVRGENGQPDREIITLAIDAGLALRAVEIASKLQRLSAGMETDHVTSDVVVGENIDDVRRKRWEQVREALSGVFDEEINENNSNE